MEAVNWRHDFPGSFILLFSVRENPEKTQINHLLRWSCTALHDSDANDRLTEVTDEAGENGDNRSATDVGVGGRRPTTPRFLLRHIQSRRCTKYCKRSGQKVGVDMSDVSRI